MASGVSFISVEAVGKRRGGSDKELKIILQKPASSWTVLGKYYGKNLRSVVRNLNMKNGYKYINFQL